MISGMREKDSRLIRPWSAPRVIKFGLAFGFLQSEKFMLRDDKTHAKSRPAPETFVSAESALCHD
jgi:hypothetical protein